MQETVVAEWLSMTAARGPGACQGWGTVALISRAFEADNADYFRQATPGLYTHPKT